MPFILEKPSIPLIWKNPAFHLFWKKQHAIYIGKKQQIGNSGLQEDLWSQDTSQLLRPFI